VIMRAFDSDMALPSGQPTARMMPESGRGTNGAGSHCR
jgi:hypothetical protein